MEHTSHSHHRHTTIVWSVIFSLLLALIIAAGIFQFTHAKNLQMHLDNTYNRAFLELSESVHEVGVSLEKDLLVSEPRQMVYLSNEINRKTEIAKASIGQLPIENTSLDNLSRFLSQVGDYTNMLAMKSIEGEVMTEQDHQTVTELIEYARSFDEEIRVMQNQFFSGDLHFGKDEATKVSANAVSLGTSLAEVEKQFANYPVLVYDGPFSTHLETKEPAMLMDQEEISMDHAKEIVKQFLGEDAQYIESVGEKGGNLAAYSFNAYPDYRRKESYIAIDVTKRGGFISNTLYTRPIGMRNISAEQALASAAEYLSTHGFENMRESYYDVNESIATINFAYVQDDVTMYTDLIKVKIAMDNGECLGIEAKGYLLNHTMRDIPEVQFSLDEVMEKVNPNLAVSADELCIIPSQSMEELFCYELRGVSRDRNFLVYVNALTGKEEKIMMLIESEDGILSE